jgi:molybdenum cofactor biosynthesis enzyme MoaA
MPFQGIPVATEELATRLVVVDAIDPSTAAFCEHCSLSRLDANGIRFAKRTSDIARGSTND